MQSNRPALTAVLSALGLAVAAAARAEPAAVTIPQIQGTGHVSPYDGQQVTTTGVVTAVAFNGYYLQDPNGDGDPATSDGIFVFKTGSKPSVGDQLQVTDRVSEFIPGGATTGNLSITQLSFPATTTLSTGNPLPASVIIGTNGRIPPTEVVISESELPVNLQDDPGIFNPETDGIDFYESLEGMRVTIEQPVAVSGTRVFSPFSSEVFTLPNDGAHVSPTDQRTARGGINLASGPDNTGNQNPERVQIQFDGTLYPAAVPPLQVGDRLDDVTGVVGYSFGNFEVNATEPISLRHASAIEREQTALVGTDTHAAIASYNVLNLSALEADDGQRAIVASHIVDNLGVPDVVALQEIQDNNGETDDGTVAADQTLQKLVDAISDAGGPGYEFFDVAPADGASGGIPGGNIRNAYLYNPARVDNLEFFSLTPDVLDATGVSDPDAFEGTRDPLLARFRFGDATFTVINNHLTSRFGSSPVFGGPQPFVQAGEAHREGQAQALNDYVDYILADDPNSQVIVTGDLNTFEFTDDLAAILPGLVDGAGEGEPNRSARPILGNLVGQLDDDNAYSFIFDGNSQVLDHMFTTPGLARRAEFDIVHVNVDFPRDDNGYEFTDHIGSDHEPIIGRFNLLGWMRGRNLKP